MKSSSDHFLDKNTLIAVVCVFLGWMAWDYHIRQKYPPPPHQPAPPGPREGVGSSPPLSASSGPSREEKPVLSPEKVFELENRLLAVELSSRGMGLKKLVLKNIMDREGREAVQLFSGPGPRPFETRLFTAGGQELPLDFQIQSIGDLHWKGKTRVKNLFLEKIFKWDPDSFFADMQVKMTGSLSQDMAVITILNQTYGLKQSRKTGFLSSLFTTPDILSFFVSSYSSGPHFIDLVSGNREKFYKEARRGLRPEVGLVALGTKYFGQAVVNQSETLPSFQFLAQGLKGWQGRLHHQVLNPDRELILSYKIFMGPKSLALFQKSSPDLMKWVDFGWFSLLARWILKILGFFHQITGNWGLAIIGLTLMVRLMLLPLVISSYRSMETMKKIQPRLTEIRQKYKKDPQRVNQEIMAVMKAHRANPIGGCLPMLLQIPVFWALWKALSSSYSLYRSPFVFWIQDLSWKDPYYVLPALIGLLMFVQQKISPQTGLNREMIKIMQILPVFVSFCMINFPSGLTLYVLVSSAFGLVQQLYLNQSQVKV